MEQQEHATFAEKEKKRDYLLPASIVIAAVLVSASLVYNAGKKPSDTTAEANLFGAAGNGVSQLDNIVPVSSDDHIFGDPDAPIKIVEFSDLECPFCKNFHYTLKNVVEMYDGKVAWVYRHFPLDSLHPKARKEAEATECAAELGGNEKFWEYMDAMMEITPSNNGLDPKELPVLAVQVGLDKTKFEECMNSGKYLQKIDAMVQDGIKSGAEGTPFSVVVTEKGKSVIPGALPFENPNEGQPSVKLIIDQVIKSL